MKPVSPSKCHALRAPIYDNVPEAAGRGAAGSYAFLVRYLTMIMEIIPPSMIVVKAVCSLACLCARVPMQIL